MKVCISVIFSIIIFGCIIFSAYRIFAEQPVEPSDKTGRLSGTKVGGYAFLFRIIVYLFSLIFVFQISDELTLNSFLDTWTRWDASNYIRIAEGWYTGYTENGDYLTLVFFPLYSIIAKLLSFIIQDIRLSLMITSTIAYSVGCGYMYEIVRIDYGEKTALNSVIWISVFPFAFFFGALMTESVFFMTTAMAFYYIRKHNWTAVGILGALSSFSRMIGIFIIVPAFIEWMDYYKPLTAERHSFRKHVFRVLPVLIAFLGIGAYLAINYNVTGNAFKFMEYQNKYWHHTNCYFGNTIADIFEYAVSNETGSMDRISIWLPEAIIFILSAMALVCSAHYLRNMYTIYLAGYIVINCSVTWLISGGRYMSAAVPLFIVAGYIGNKNKYANIVMIAISFTLMIIYLYRYLTNMQVM